MDEYEVAEAIMENIGDFGNVDIAVPRDRNSEFSPKGSYRVLWH